MGRQRVGMTRAASDAARVLGQQIRMARQEQGLTMAALADRALVSERTVSTIERGGATPSVGNVFKVAIAAGVPLFGAETRMELQQLRRIGQDKLALIPTRVRYREPRFDANF